jgi:hypothetical protein
MTPLYDILSAAPAVEKGAFRHKELRLAMSVGRRRHYRLDHIQPRHFEETAALAKVPPEIRRQAFAQLAEIGLPAIDTVADALPSWFPDRVAGPIIAHAKNRMTLLTEQVGTGLLPARKLIKDVEPEVLRRFDVPLKIKLNRLHDVIQAAMGWTDTHLYEFRAAGVGWGVPRPEYDDDGPLPASKTSLLDVIEDVGTKTIHYIYDFGDNWHHVIKVEKIDDAIPGGEYPRLVRAIGACPPEDVGGGPGYADFLEVMADPNHEEHARMLKWHGGKFDPDEAEIGRILVNFERLAKKWGPKPRKPKAV